MLDNQTHEWERIHRICYQHQLLGEWEIARSHYEQALSLNPDYAFAQLSLAQLDMLQSRFSEGRERYEARFGARDNNGFDWRTLPIPRWRGESLENKHLHLWVEQGFGDVIMYAGFLPHLLAQKPARITLSMFPKMMMLFARSFPEIVVESFEEIGNYALASTIVDTFPALLTMAQQTGLQIDLEPMRSDYERALKRGKPDYTAPMGDLMVYGLPDYIPAQHPSYIIADPEHVAKIKQSSGAGRRIGISWHTNNPENGPARSIPLEQWIPLLRTPNCHFISLQHHVAPAEIARFCAENGCNIITDQQFDPLQDTEALAALIASMDEIITIDNSNAHLAGALGIPTTLLLPKGCDFRWPILENTPDTLWYNSVKTERQTQAMDWPPVIERVRGYIGKLK